MTQLATGTIDGHEARGVAVLRSENGRLRVELSDLWVAPGAPDVRLYVSPRPDGHFDQTAIDLGKIPDRTDHLNAEVPEDVEAHNIGSVIIYCTVYSVLFGNGALTPAAAR